MGSGYPPPPIDPPNYLPPPPPPGSGYPAPPPLGYPQGYGYAGSGTARNNGMAIAALVCGIVGVLVAQFILGPLAFIFGLVARNQIRSSNGAQKGEGMAIAGIVLGIVAVAIFVLIAIYAEEIQDFIDSNST